MDKKPKISESEMEIMRVLWANGGWANVGMISEAVAGRKWKYKTVGTFLLRLTEKGALESRKEGNMNQFRPRFTEAEFKHMETDAFLREVHGGSMDSLMASLCGGAADSEMLEQLEIWLKQQESR